jgi:alanine dehydrogenase
VVRQVEALAKGLNTYQGHCVCAPVAQALGLPYTALSDRLG